MALPLYKNREVLFHTAFWAVYISFIIYHISSYQHGPTILWGRVLLGALISIGYVAVLSYVNYFYLIPVLLIRKKTGRFIIAFVLCFGALTFFRFEMEDLAFRYSRAGARSPMGLQVIVEGIISDLFIVAFVGLLRFASDWLKLDSRRRELEKEKLNAELKFLKAQVNPHFFFNTLNNLYYLATIQSDKTPLVISKLSDVMRYMIYESNHEKVELAKEIEYMQHYISLEQMRLREGVELVFEVSGRTDVLISPLILITFLENAFKHGASNSSGACWIKARVEVDGDLLVYHIGNSKPAAINGVKNDGIGLINVRRRLDLAYPGRYQLNIEDKDSSYAVLLTIDRP